jgi:TP901 family phage tail tape measure protein
VVRDFSIYLQKKGGNQLQRIEGLSIALDLDTLRLDRGLTGLKDRLRTVNSEMRNNMSAFDRGDKSVAKYETRLRGLNKKLETQKAVTKAAKAEYEKMVDEHGEGSKEAEKAAREYNNQAAALNNLDRYVANTREELEKLKRQQEFANSRWGRMSSNLDDFSERMNKTGTKMMGVGRTMTTKVTLPIVGLGTAALKAGMDFQASMSEVKAISGATGKDFKSLEDKAKEMGKTTRFSASESAQAMKYMALAGWDTKQILDGIPGVLHLAAAGNMDLAQASDIVTDTMSMYGMKAEEAAHASDVFAFAQANANTNVEQMGEAMKYAGPVANSLGISFEDTASAMMVLADSGLKGSIAGQAFASSLGRLAKPTKQMKGTMKELGLSFFDAEGNIKPIPKIIGELEKGTKGMTKEQKSAALTTLFGAEAYKHWAVLLEGGSKKLQKNTKDLEKSDGAAAKMAKTMQDNAKGSTKNFMSALENLAIVASEHLLPPITDMIDKLTVWTRKFGSLSPTTQKATLAIVGLAAAIGPLTFVFGGAFRAVGMFTGGLSKVIKYFGKTQLNSKAAGKSLLGFGGVASKSGTQAVKTSVGFGKVAGTLGGVGRIAGIARLGLSALGGPMGLLATIAIPALIDGGIKLVNHLKEESIPAVTGFGDKVSESTTKAILGYEKLNDEATTQLNQLFWSGQAITEEGSQKLIQTFSSMTNQIAENMKTKSEESYQSMSDFFASSKALSDKEEQAILTKMQEGHLKQQQEIQKNEDRIKEILNTASKEKRSLTKAEKKEINQIQDSMRKTAVQTMSKSQIEQEAIMTELKTNSGNITARQAAETVKNSKKAKDGAVKEANKKFEKVRDWATYEWKVTGNLSKEEADKIIKDARKTRDESIKKAEEKHKGVVKQAKKQAKGHVKEVDWANGEILSNWDKLIVGVAKAVNKVTSGINWVLRKIGLEKLQIPKWKPKGYEKGTPRSGHPGGPAIVGEKGRELAHIPGQGITMLGEKGPQFIDLPKGTSVLPNKHTENLLKSYGFPGYEKGIGDFFDLAISSPKKLISKVWSKFLGDLPSFGGYFKDIFNGTVSYVKKGASKYIKKKLDDFLSFGDDVGGKITGSLSKWINAAIKIAGVPQSWFKPLTTIAIKESGGNPRAINRWDINAKRGIPSMGLMQTIRPTFEAHKKKGFNNILNPVHNILAAIGYIKSRYGNVWNVPGIKAMRKSGKYVGYKTGGLVKNRGLYELVEDGWPEYVIPTNPSRRTEAMKLLALAGKDIQRSKQGNKRPSQLPNVNTNNDLEAKVNELVNMIGRLLQKNNNEITQNITINSPEPTSPAENARKFKQASQQLAMEWRR